MLISLSAFFFIFQIIYFVANDKKILGSIPMHIQNFIKWFGIYHNKKNFDSIPIGVETILIFIFIFFFLYEQLKDVKDLPIYSHYFFWISIGLFIYLGGSFFIYIYANTLSRQETDQYWFFTYVVEIIKNLLFTAAVVIYSKNPNKTSVNRAVPNLDFM